MYGTLALLYINCRSKVSSVTSGYIEDVPRIIDNFMISPFWARPRILLFCDAKWRWNDGTMKDKPFFLSFLSRLWLYFLYLSFLRLCFLQSSESEWYRPRMRTRSTSFTPLFIAVTVWGLWWSPRASRIGTVWEWWARSFIFVSISVPKSRSRGRHRYLALL